MMMLLQMRTMDDDGDMKERVVSCTVSEKGTILADENPSRNGEEVTEAPTSMP